MFHGIATVVVIVDTRVGAISTCTDVPALLIINRQLGSYCRSRLLGVWFWCLGPLIQVATQAVHKNPHRILRNAKNNYLDMLPARCSPPLFIRPGMRQNQSRINPGKTCKSWGLFSKEPPLKNETLKPPLDPTP